MTELFLRALAAPALFLIAGCATLFACKRGRGGTVVGVVLAGSALSAAAMRSFDPLALLAGPTLGAFVIWRGVVSGQGVWRVAIRGLIPVVAAMLLGVVGLHPGEAWQRVQDQVSTWAGPAQTSDETPESRALAEEYERLGKAAVRWTMRLLPGEIVVYALTQVLVLVLIAGRWARSAGFVQIVLPMVRWRVRFEVVWVLVLGLALVALRRTPAQVVGLNLVLIAAAPLGIQGLAVLWTWLARGLTRPARWLVLGSFVLTALPFLVAGVVLLGAADMWADFRRLEAAAPDPDRR